jgi:hypothetical protein
MRDELRHQINTIYTLHFPRIRYIYVLIPRSGNTPASTRSSRGGRPRCRAEAGSEAPGSCGLRQQRAVRGSPETGGASQAAESLRFLWPWNAHTCPLAQKYVMLLMFAHRFTDEHGRCALTYRRAWGKAESLQQPLLYPLHYTLCTIPYTLYSPYILTLYTYPTHYTLYSMHFCSPRSKHTHASKHNYHFYTDNDNDYGNHRDRDTCTPSYTHPRIHAHNTYIHMVARMHTAVPV